MTKLGIFASTILVAAGAASVAWAADATATKAAPATASATTSASAPKTCTGVWDFIETDCQLTWYGITLYGAIDDGFEPSRPVVQWQRLCRRQLSELWHADGFSAELADVRRCSRVRSDGRVLRVLSHRLAGNHLRRRQHRKLQAHDLAEISPHGRPGPRGGDLAVRWLRAEQRLQWRLPGRGGRRYP